MVNVHFFRVIHKRHGIVQARFYQRPSAFFLYRFCRRRKVLYKAVARVGLYPNVFYRGGVSYGGRVLRKVNGSQGSRFFYFYVNVRSASTCRVSVFTVNGCQGTRAHYLGRAIPVRDNVRSEFSILTSYQASYLGRSFGVHGLFSLLSLYRHAGLRSVGATPKFYFIIRVVSGVQVIYCQLYVQRNRRYHVSAVHDNLRPNVGVLFLFGSQVTRVCVRVGGS